jgi:hypothetical protein
VGTRKCNSHYVDLFPLLAGDDDDADDDDDDDDDEDFHTASVLSVATATAATTASAVSNRAIEYAIFSEISERFIYHKQHLVDVSLRVDNFNPFSFLMVSSSTQ